MLKDAKNDTAFNDLMSTFKGDAVQDFYANPVPHLVGAGIPVVPAATMPAQHQATMNAAFATMNAGAANLALGAAIATSGEKVSIEKHWWGVTIVMNEKMTQDIIAGTQASGKIGAAIASAFAAAGTITGGAATAIGAAIGICVAAKVFEIKVVDNGKGVSWPITWLQWGALTLALPGGPAGIAAAGMVFLHPTRN